MAESRLRRQQNICSPAPAPPAGGKNLAAGGEGDSSAGSLNGARFIVRTNLPSSLPPCKSELALWRAFLAEEIDAILRDEE
jgi:hypothetical protein